MDHSNLFDKIEDLTDLEIAVLLCFVAGEHCIIDTEKAGIDDLENELRLVMGNVFGLPHTVIHCSPETSLEEFSNAVLFHDVGSGNDENHPSVLRSSNGESLRLPGPFTSSRSSQISQEKSDSQLRSNYAAERKVFNVIIATNFDQTADDVQLRALDLLQYRRICTRTAVHFTPRNFLFIPLVASRIRGLPSKLNQHLNDYIFISHYHDLRDGYANLEDDIDWLSDDRDSMSSVVRKPTLSVHNISTRSATFGKEDIDTLRGLGDSVNLSAEVTSYLQNLIIFLRLNRAVASGVSAKATSQFQLLVRCLAPLQRTDYVFPSLVAVAARKIYRHRISVANPNNDRSLLYGSTLKAVKSVLADVTAESIIEDAITEVEAPL